MWFNILGFWVVGFTSGWALTFKAGLGLSGIWIGILSGVTTTGLSSDLGPIALDWYHCPVYLRLCGANSLREYSSGITILISHLV